MRRGIAIGAAAAAIWLMVPAAATATHSDWQDGGAGAPTSTNFEDVALTAGVTVAVGAAGDGAAIYRRTGAGWVKDTLGLPAGASEAKLVDVAVGDGAAWTVGTYKVGEGEGTTAPLVARLGGTDLTGTTATAWTRLGAEGAPVLPTGLTDPRSVAVRGTHVLIGASDGKVYPADLAGTFGSAIAPTGATPAVNGLAIHTATDSAADAFAGTNVSSGKSIYVVRKGSASAMFPALTADATAMASMVSIASDGMRAYGVEPGTDVAAPQIWTVNSAHATTASWTRETPSAVNGNSRLDSVDVVGGEAAVAGRQGSNGAVWRRGGTGAWRLDREFVNRPLTGVAIGSTTDIWAVGPAGTVLHFTPQGHPEPSPDPDPVPDTTITSGPSGATTDPNVTFTFTSDQAPVQFECSLDGAAFTPCGSPHSYSDLPAGGHVFDVRARNSAGIDATPARREFAISRPTREPAKSEPSVVIGGGSGEGRQCKAAPRKLAKKVRVKARRKSIRIRFKLKRRAKVRAVAKRGKKVVGKTRKKIFRRGKQHVKFKVKKQPTTVRLIVKPAKSCR